MSKLHGRDLLEEMQWKYANGPLPAHRRRKKERESFRGCVVITLWMLGFCVVVLLLAKWILF